MGEDLSVQSSPWRGSSSRAMLLLAVLAAPATAQVEVGENDFKISGLFELGELSPAADAGRPAVAYNSTDHEFLVVWQGDDDVDGGLDDELHVFGQRLRMALFYDGFESGDTSAW